MKILKIDNKWSIEYDPDNNNRPTRVFRYDEIATGPGPNEWTNDIRAMFYALLNERENPIHVVAQPNDGGVFTACGIGELHSQVQTLAQQGYLIITVIDTQNGYYHVVAQER